MTTVTDFRTLTPYQAQSFMERSRRHRDLVKEYDVLLKSALKSAIELALLTADLERMQRAQSSSGSVSTRLFIDETLRDVVVTGKAAWSQRAGNGWSEDVAFVRRGKRWYIRLFASRPGISPPKP